MIHTTLESAKKEMTLNGAVVLNGTTDNCNIIECYSNEERIGHIYSSYTSDYKKVYITKYTA